MIEFALLFAIFAFALIGSFLLSAYIGEGDFITRTEETITITISQDGVLILTLALLYLICMFSYQVHKMVEYRKFIEE